MPLETEGRVVSADPSPEGPRLLNIYGPGIVVQWTEPQVIKRYRSGWAVADYINAGH